MYREFTTGVALSVPLATPGPHLPPSKDPVEPLDHHGLPTRPAPDP